ncbi:hypothetical protein V495_05936 [Pseudogymnoascus sp. VKM F-4514 (FW-929)]|nr:hypothetical protein V495_05936 [Pseudogymnoascus sp. VKM F-4514 (FW-929)]KFY66348.1 hypothetical protein V497_01010 [Pseudogymnoascus sp. VKM F-4516 (FW-969)]
MRRINLRRAAVILGLLSPISAVLVAPTSDCAISCGNVLDATTNPDIACGDKNFGSGAGQTFKKCVQCELESTFVDPTGLSDLTAVIYNLRYAADYCIFNDSKVATTPCVTSSACLPFLDSLTYHNNTAPSGATDYGYCNAWDDSDISRCQDCVESLQDEEYLVNFLTIISASCQQKPGKGALIGIDGDPFSSSRVEITKPYSSADIIASSFNPPSGPLDLGAKIGIAVGGFLLILIVLGTCIIWRGRRRRRAVLANYAASPSMAQAPRWKGTDDSPQSMSSGAFMTGASNYQWPAQSTDDSPASAISRGGGGGASFSPYVSQHTSPSGPAPGGREFPHVPIPAPYRRESIGSLRPQGELIEMSPLGESERERWEREAGAVGFVPAPAPATRQHSER